MPNTFNNPIFYQHGPEIYNKTLNWFGSDLPEKFISENNLYTDKNILYTFNKNGFRCDDFDCITKCRIVFLGCSITEGIGVKLEEVWAYKLLELIKQATGLHIPYWNLALGGNGIDAQVRAYYHYYQKLKPNLVIGFLPPPHRRELYIEENDSIAKFVLSQDTYYQENLLFLNEKNISYECEKNFSMLDLMLQKYNTKLLWRGWGYDSFPQDFYWYHNLKFPWDRKGRDSLHPGPDAHKKFAEEMFSANKEKILSTLKGW